MGILRDILENKKREVARNNKAFPLSRVKDLLAKASPVKDFSAAIASEGLSLIAEVKKASPSAGVIKSDLDPAKLAQSYEQVGADAISVVTDNKFFHGELWWMGAVEAAVKVPVLHKEFVIDEYQIYDSRKLGADAVLLIARILDDEKLARFFKLAQDLGMASLVEVHSSQELERVLGVGAGIIGINNRNLDTLDVDIKTTGRLRRFIPEGKLVVSESGLKTLDDLKYLEDLGVDAVLIGEALIRGEGPFSLPFQDKGS